MLIISSSYPPQIVWIVIPTTTFSMSAGWSHGTAGDVINFWTSPMTCLILRMTRLNGRSRKSGTKGSPREIPIIYSNGKGGPRSTMNGFPQTTWETHKRPSEGTRKFEAYGGEGRPRMPGARKRCANKEDRGSRNEEDLEMIIFRRRQGARQGYLTGARRPRARRLTTTTPEGKGIETPPRDKNLLPTLRHIYLLHRTIDDHLASDLHILNQGRDTRAVEATK